MNGDLTGLAFGAGMVAAFNPCGFAMLPAYLTLVIEGEGRGSDAAVRRALAATVAMAAGFLTVFGLFGLLTVSVASAVQQRLPYATMTIGILLAGLGIWLLSGRDVAAWSVGKGERWAPTARLGSLVGYGIGYALASLSCTAGPFLAVTASSLRSGSPLTVLSVYAAYAAGMALVVGVLAVAVASASGAVVDRMRRMLRYVNRISGAILIPAGLYVAYYGWYEVRLYTGGRPEDPVISAAGRVQRVLAGWVYQSGGWPWLAALVALVGVALGARSCRRRRRPVEPAPARIDSPS